MILIWQLKLERKFKLKAGKIAVLSRSGQNHVRVDKKFTTVKRSNMRVKKQEHCVLKHTDSPSGQLSGSLNMLISCALMPCCWYGTHTKVDFNTAGVKFPKNLICRPCLYFSP